MSKSKSVVFSLRITEDEQKRITQLAANAGTPVPQYARAQLLQETPSTLAASYYLSNNVNQTVQGLNEALATVKSILGEGNT